MDLTLAGTPGEATDIRIARTSDLERLLEHVQRCFSGDRLSRRSFRRLLGRESAVISICEHGYLLLLLRNNSKTARIYSVAVAPEARGRGLGRRLIAHGEQLARARGCEHVQLEVRVDNFAAIALYESLGYTASKQISNYYEDGQSARRYRKSLASNAT